MSREEIVRSTMLAHGLSQDLAQQVVLPDGSIDSGKLQLVKNSIAWGHHPGSRTSPELVQNLIAAYETAKAERRVADMISLKGALSRLGHHLD